MTTTMTKTFQPLLHDSVVLLAAPSQAWSNADGDMYGYGIQGFYHSESRVLSEIALLVEGRQPEHLSNAIADATTATFVSLARNVDDHTADPRVRIDRTRRIGDGSLAEEISLVNALATEIETEVTLRLASDFSEIQTVKSGRVQRAIGIRAWVEGETVRLEAGSVTATVLLEGAALTVDDGVITAIWTVTIPARSSVTLHWRIDATDSSAVVQGAREASEWADLRVRTDDSRLAAWVGAAVKDLDALRMVTSDRPNDVFLAAGAPWFFTLFGRDSIWAARFLLPLGTKLAASTLRTLAARQGIREVAETAEQPGKIMHELRPGVLTIPGESVSLPPLYYGTVDATALWINLLHDAWKWGMSDAEVEALLPNLEAALAWMRDYGDSDGDGFLEYVDATGHGLANQGWKDSGDSIQWRDGSLADGPIALCEVQGYAYEAAVGAAEILEHFGRPSEAWRAWAASLKQRFAESFWIDAPDGAYPAVALDVNKKRVDTVTSNIGHLLGTGILDEDGSRLVAARLASPELNSGFGLRTMSSDSAGFWPLSYHGGSVWTHDTAIAISGLGRAGFEAEAASLIDGLLNAADSFGYRMPELHSGDAASDFSAPVPYPAACHPQAWSAAAAIAVLSTSLGIRPNDDGSVRLAPLAGVGAIVADGLRIAGRSFDVSTDADGQVTRNTLAGA
ncbi:MAG: amylo-alpha,6-glucosidase [Leifsonia sp.]|nr:amylo-alpha,6-glucosidase [Leifsonia sp.]